MSENQKRNIQVIYKSLPQGLPDPEKTFEVKESTIDLEAKLSEDQILIRTLYMSVDPYMRFRLRDPSIKSYFPAAIVDTPFAGGVVGEVIKTTDKNFKEGDVVVAFSTWEEYSIISTKSSHVEVTVIPNARQSQVPLSYFLGVLGMPGITAYVGLHKICEPFTPGQTLYVSAASGAVGQVVGQYAKTFGLRVVGSAGDDEKVNYLLKDLGFDAAFNYKKHEDLEAILKETCPNGIDIYFENVGGKMLDAVLEVANNFCRIPICGMISQYNRSDNPEPIYKLGHLIGKRIRMEGFIVTDDMKKSGGECIKTFSKLLQEGKMKYRETVSEGIEKAPKAFVDMLQGKNFGKALVKVADL